MTGQWLHERALGVLLAGLVALAGLAGIRSVSATPPPDVGPGCDEDRPAVAHVAGGELLAKQPNGGPVVCGMHTGFAGGETSTADPGGSLGASRGRTNPAAVASKRRVAGGRRYREPGVVRISRHAD